MSDQNNPHFTQIFWFCVYVFTAGFAYIIAVTFLPIPEKNQRIVDTATGFVLGSMIMSAIGYLLGGNPATATKKTSILPENSDTLVQTTTNTEQPKETQASGADTSNIEVKGFSQRFDEGKKLLQAIVKLIRF